MERNYEQFEFSRVDHDWITICDHIIFGLEDKEMFMKPNRTQLDSGGDFGMIFEWSLEEGFPILQVKRVAFKSMIAELCWFIRGQTDIQFLRHRNCTIWDEWVKPDGTIGPAYGAQWRGRNGCSHNVDQLLEACRLIMFDPSSRRIIVNSWNITDLPQMALSPCHYSFQFKVSGESYERLDLMFQMRSVDVFLGLPFNIASYAALLHVIATLTGKIPGNLTASLGDTHLYENQIEPARQISDRMARSEGFDIDAEYHPPKINYTPLTPTLKTRYELPTPRSMEQIKYELDNIDITQFSIDNYHPWPAIKVDVAI